MIVLSWVSPESRGKRSLSWLPPTSESSAVDFGVKCPSRLLNQNKHYLDTSNCPINTASTKTYSTFILTLLLYVAAPQLIIYPCLSTILTISLSIVNNRTCKSGETYQNPYFLFRDLGWAEIICWNFVSSSSEESCKWILPKLSESYDWAGLQL